MTFISDLAGLERRGNTRYHPRWAFRIKNHSQKNINPYNKGHLGFPLALSGLIANHKEFVHEPLGRNGTTGTC